MPQTNATPRLGTAGSVVLVGVESDFTPDVMDSIARLGARITASVLLDDAAWDLAGLSPHGAQDAPQELRAMNFFVPRNIPGLRKAATDTAGALGFSSLVTIIDPAAVLSPSAILSRGVYVNAGAVIASQTVLGNSVFVNRLASVGHHAVLEDFVSVGPGAHIASKVRIGRGTMVGAGASIAPGVTIGSNTVIGAGAAVHKDVPSNVVALGNPCRIAKAGIPGHRGYSV